MRVKVIKDEKLKVDKRKGKRRKKGKKELRNPKETAYSHLRLMDARWFSHVHDEVYILA